MGQDEHLVGSSSSNVVSNSPTVGDATGVVDGLISSLSNSNSSSNSSSSSSNNNNNNKYGDKKRKRARKSPEDLARNKKPTKHLLFKKTLSGAFENPLPKCSAVSCIKFCCGGYQRLEDGDKKAWAKKVRDMARAQWKPDNKKGPFEFALSLMNTRQKYVRQTSTFRCKPMLRAAGAIKSGCSYCNTLSGDIDRNHKFGPLCPRQKEGLALLDKHGRPSRVVYELPNPQPGGVPVIVSRNFFEQMMRFSRAVTDRAVKLIKQRKLG